MRFTIIITVDTIPELILVGYILRVGCIKRYKITYPAFISLADKTGQSCRILLTGDWLRNDETGNGAAWLTIVVEVEIFVPAAKGKIIVEVEPMPGRFGVGIDNE